MSTVPNLSACRYLAAAAMLLPLMYAQGQQPRAGQAEVFLDKVSRQQLVQYGEHTGNWTRSQARSELGLTDDNAPVLRQPLQGGVFSHAELEFSGAEGKLERTRIYIADPKPWSEVSSQLASDLPCSSFKPTESASGTTYACLPGIYSFVVNGAGQLEQVVVEKNDMVVRIGGNVMAAKLVKQTPPVYPPQAREAKIQGTVRFNALIGRDGTIEKLTLVSGHPLFVPPAMTAVQQWVYEPVLLNGAPVKVNTVIDVNFALLN